MRKFSTFYQVVNYLRKTVKCKYPFYVRLTDLDNMDGSCEEMDCYFLIKIEKSLPENFAIDVFLHEIAHAHSWSQNKNIHGKNWGISYAYVYRKFLTGFIPKS